MNLFLVVLILILLVAFYFLFQENKKIKVQHQQEVLNLNTIISELISVQTQQNGALQLSEELKLKLLKSRVEIDKKLLNLQNELIVKLSTNGLADAI